MLKKKFIFLFNSLLYGDIFSGQQVIKTNKCFAFASRNKCSLSFPVVLCMKGINTFANKPTIFIILLLFQANSPDRLFFSECAIDASSYISPERLLTIFTAHNLSFFICLLSWCFTQLPKLTD